MRKRLYMGGRLAVLMAGVLLMGGLAGGCESKLKTERDALYAQNRELQGALGSTRGALEATNSDLSRLVAQNAQLQEELAAAPDPAAPGAAGGPGASGFEGIEGVSIQQGMGRIAVRVPGDVLFAPGQADIKNAAKRTLNEVAGVIKGDYAGKIVRVEGYSDSDPIRKSEWKDNLELSAARAMSVERYLESQGIPSDEMYSAGFGATKLQPTKAQSRRVEIVVIMQ